MRIILFLAALALGFAAPAAAQPTADHRAAGYPEAAVRAIYGAVVAGDYGAYSAVDPGVPLTPRLAALFAAERAYGEANDDIGRIDFDWAVNGQDFLLTGLAFETRAVPPRVADEPERAVVTASFANFDRPTQVDWYWQRDGDGTWRLDDVVGGDPQGETYSLSLILGYGF